VPGPGDATFVVRRAEAGDNRALCALARRCPTQADIEICVHREPDYLTLDALLGGDWRVFVAENEQGIVGSVVGSVRRVFVNGNPTVTGYIGDLKVEPAHRRCGTATSLIASVREGFRVISPHLPVLFTALRGNPAVQRLARVTSPQSQPCGVIRIHSIPLLGRLQPGTIDGYTVQPAAESDVQEMMSLWTARASERQFTPPQHAASFAEYLHQAPGLDLTSYLVARDRRGRVAAFAAFWDQRSLKTTRVLNYPPRLNAFRRAYNTMAPFLRAATLPAPGEVLRGLSVFHLAYRRAVGRDYAFISVGLDTRDPAIDALRGLWAQPTDVHAFLTTPGGTSSPPELDGRPLRFETALV
jgi:predicted N-acetyltransferase YhbS